VFLQNYQVPGIFGINELFFYRKFDRIVPWSIDQVHGGWSTSPRTLIKWESSADGSTAQIKTREGVSDNLIVAVNTGMNGSRWLDRQGRRDRGGAPGLRRRLTGVSDYQRSGSPNSTRSSPTTLWQHGDLNLLTLGWQQTAVAAGNSEATRLASDVITGKLRCSSGEDEGTKGGGGLRRSFLDGRFGTGGGTPARRWAKHGS
jgi:hypothetical protein